MEKKNAGKTREAVGQWYRQLCATNNDAFIPLFFDRHRYLVLRGGGGSGKSIFAGRKVLERVTSERGHRFLVCRKVARTLRESCFAQLRSQIGAFYPNSVAKINRGDMTITFRNGSQIIFAGLDDVEKLKSIFDITGIWIEEASELEEGDFSQLDIRLRTDCPHYLQIILTFNPISITHWLKGRFWDRHDPRAHTHESTYKDNRFLTKEAVATLEAFRDSDPYHYMVYALNQWGVTGKTVFDASAISRRLERLEGPVKQGYFAYAKPDELHITDIRWVEDEHGPLAIYREPEPGRPYVVGGDTSGDGSDWFVGQVLDNITGRQVARLRHQYDEDTYAEQMYCLGWYYNMALLAPEANFSTYPIKRLQQLGYQNLYIREVEDNFDGKIKHAFGFRTDSLTRPVILAQLIRVAREHIELICDEQTLLEMLTFVRNEAKGLRMEAEPGAKDDCVMALAIAHHSRSQQAMAVQVDNRTDKAAPWTADMWEDYNRAGPELRQAMLAQWGSPN